MEREERWISDVALQDARTRKGNMHVHAVVWIGKKINIACLDREYTIITSYYYIGSNTFILAYPAPYTCWGPI